MAEIPESTNPPRAGSEGGDALLGLALMAATVALPILGGYIIERMHKNKEVQPPKIRNANNSTLARSVTPEIPSALLGNTLRDISAQDRRGDLLEIIGRDREINKMASYLGGNRPQSLLLVGDKGIGKTALVEGLAQTINKGIYPELRNFVILEMDPHQLIGKDANTVIDEICQVRDQCIIFLNNFQNLLNVATITHHPIDLTYFEKVISNHLCRCIVAISQDGYNQLNENHPNFGRVFMLQRVEKRANPDEMFGELNRDIVFQILSQKVCDYPNLYGLQVKPNAIEVAITLSEKYDIREGLPEHLPGKGINLLEETAKRLRPLQTTLPTEVIEANHALEELESRKQRVESNPEENDPNKLNEIKSLIEETRSKKDRLLASWKEVEKQQQSLYELVFDIAVLNRAVEASIANKATVLTGMYKNLLSPKMEKQGRLKKSLEVLSDQFSCLRTDIEGGDVARILSEIRGVPIHLADEDEREKLRNLEKNLKRRVIGQDQAIHTVAQTIIRNRTDKSDSEKPKPIGRFLLVGTSGVGKTELAKALAETWFGDERLVIREDMNEYREHHHADRLIGSPPGYIDSNRGGQLTNKVIEKPYSVVLLDEIDKAEGSIVNLFLRPLDEGMMKDARGRVVDFTHTIIIFTSNYGLNEIREWRRQGMDPEEFKRKVRTLYYDKMGDPFIARFPDGPIVFNNLNREILLGIIDLQFQGFKTKLEQQKFLVDMTAAAREYILEHSDAEHLGARGIRDQFDSTLSTSFSSKLLNKEILPKDSLLVDCLDDQLILKKIDALNQR